MNDPTLHSWRPVDQHDARYPNAKGYVVTVRWSRPPKRAVRAWFGFGKVIEPAKVGESVLMTYRKRDGVIWEDDECRHLRTPVDVLLALYARQIHAGQHDDKKGLA